MNATHISTAALFGADIAPSRNPALVEFASRLRAYLHSELGFDVFATSAPRAYIAGGAFRDFLGNDGIIAKDIDILFDSPDAEFSALLARIEAKFAADSIDRYKPQNWCLTPTRDFAPGVTIQVSRHPDISRFFSLCSESMNAFLYDGQHIWVHPDAEADARARTFSILNCDPEFTTAERARMGTARVEKFIARGYTFHPNALWTRMQTLASEAQT